MTRIKLIISAVLLAAFVLATVQARPRYMRRYNADPGAKAAYKNKCTICHIGKGGAENTSFGEDFAGADYQFTPELKAKYKRYFK
jgi:hypothetical protein